MVVTRTYFERLTMHDSLDDYIIYEAKTDWIGDCLHSGNDEDAICSFVKRMVVDALMDSQLAHKYLKDFE